METGKNKPVCGWWLASVLIKRDSALCRHYYVIGLLQPRYVMPNLMAKTTIKKEKWGGKVYKLL